MHKSRLAAVKIKKSCRELFKKRPNEVCIMYEECIIRKSLVKRVDVVPLRWFGHVELMSNEHLIKVFQI